MINICLINFSKKIESLNNFGCLMAATVQKSIKKKTIIFSICQIWIMEYVEQNVTEEGKKNRIKLTETETSRTANGQKTLSKSGS